VRRPSLAGAFARSPRLSGRTVGDAYVVVAVDERGADLDTVLRLNRVAAFVWERLDGQATGDAVVNALVARFDVERERAAADYLELLGTLLERGAVVPAGDPAPGASLTAVRGGG
jgi:hypothetical protein